MKNLFFSFALVFPLAALLQEEEPEQKSKEDVKRILNERADAMAAAADAWVQSLPPELYARGRVAFDDQRLDWGYHERVRSGVALGEMTGEQRILFDKLLREAFSGEGYQKVHSVLLLEQEAGRDPLSTVATVFGDPGDGPWGWRLEGQHLSINFTIEHGELVIGSPLFLGAEPAEVQDGVHAGFKLFQEEERLARELVASFSERQRKIAVHSPGKAPEGNTDERYGIPPDELVLGPGRFEDFDKRVGLSPSSMSFAQRFLFMRLLNLHVSALHPDLVTPIMLRYREHDIFDHTFLWVGSEEPGDPYYYRLHSAKKKYGIEVLNRGNHVDVVWRDLNFDFGIEPLKELAGKREDESLQAQDG